MKGIKKKGKTAIKTFSSVEEALYFQKLYNSFEQHVKVEQTGNTVQYPFVQGITLEKYLQTNSSVETIYNALGAILQKAHAPAFSTIENYDKVCMSRELFTPISAFEKCTGYKGNIHGDLTTKNILIKEDESIVLIDRLRETGDLLFDFSFIMSSLGLFYETDQTNQLHAIDSFFDTYLSDSPFDVDNFFTAFRNNFLNYAHFIAKTDFYETLPFQEWVHVEAIAKDLMQYKTFTHYLSALQRK